MDTQKRFQANSGTEPPQNEEERELYWRRKKFASAVPPRFRGATIDNYECTHERQKKVVSKVSELMSGIKELLESWRPILFFGTPGTGKDHLLTCLIRVAIQAHNADVKLLAGDDLYGGLTRRRHSDYEDWFKTLKSATVLAISDLLLPGGDPTEDQRNGLFSLVSNRYDRMRPVWATVNVGDLDELAARLGTPTVDRLREGGSLIPCFWPSYRSTEAKKQ
jgi:DNA replication protein DnaC